MRAKGQRITMDGVLSSLFLVILSFLFFNEPVRAASVSGTVSYWGRQTGEVWVVATTSALAPLNLAMGSSAAVPIGAGVVSFTNEAFALTNLPGPGTYWVHVWRDSNSDGSNDTIEAKGTLVASPVTVADSLTGVQVTLLDPDDDPDGVPDWWQVKYGLRRGAFGDGSDGDLAVSQGQTNRADSVVATVIGVNAAGSSQLAVSSTNGFHEGDVVLIIAMQDPNTNWSQNSAGQYELARVNGLRSNSLTLLQPLANQYAMQTTERVQVLRIPQYGSVVVNGTLTCSPWNGTNGGVLAFFCHSLAVEDSGTVGADCAGYRGGTGLGGTPHGQDGLGMAGERTTGCSTGRETDSGERPQGGGGAGEMAYAAGGGGGYGTDGGGGGGTAPGSGASAFGTNRLSRLYCGGGGGSSGSSADGRSGVSGGNGGGIVFIRSGLWSGTGHISAQGAAGQNGVKIYNSASGWGGGGGAGGSILLMGRLTSSLHISARGGVGGLDWQGGTSGGAGGSGRIHLDISYASTVPVASPAVGFFTSNVCAPDLDSDSDGFPDVDEYAFRTDPTDPDTDHDGLPDFWEVKYGLNPLADLESSLTPAGDKLTYLQKYTLGLDPTNTDTDGDGFSDFDEVFFYRTDPLQRDAEGRRTRFYYDRQDRLVGADYPNRLGLVYRYDGNGNIVRQSCVIFTNGFPSAWRVLNGLTNGSVSDDYYSDPDGDGWSNYQEWQAQTSPTDAASIPDIYGSTGTTAATYLVGFTPSNFVMAVGQLDGQGAEEIVIGADGNPGTVTNAILILSQTFSGWSTQRVDIGKVGITSIVIGQPTNSLSPAIYLGTRQAGGTGSIIQVAVTTNGWQAAALSISNTGQVAYVLGVRSNNDVLAHLSLSNAPDQALFSVTMSNATWQTRMVNTNTSHRGLGCGAFLGAMASQTQPLRLLDGAGIQYFVGEVVPSNSINRPGTASWYLLTPTAMTWSNAESYARQAGCDLATVDDAAENTWIRNTFASAGLLWLGLYSPSGYVDGFNGWSWVSGMDSYWNWPWSPTGEPNHPPNNQWWVQMYADGTWDNTSWDSLNYGVVEASHGSFVIAEPGSSHKLLWCGYSLTSGFQRQTKNASIFYLFIDDINSNSVADAGDSVVVTEYGLKGGNYVTNTSTRSFLTTSSPLSPSYGLSCVNYLNNPSNEVFFTGEPDGCVYSWMASNPTGALQRQLFSAKYAGKSWHQLAGHKGLNTTGEALAGLCVDPASPSKCSIIYWSPQTALWSPQQIKQTPPITRIMPDPRSGAGLSVVKVKVWDAEGNQSTPCLQVSYPGTNNWTDATVLKLDGMNYSYTMTVAAMPTGCVHSLLWNSGADLGPGFSGTVYLRSRSRDMDTGNWSAPVLYHLEVSNDSNHDGIPDAWCMQFGLDPLATNGPDHATGSADGTGVDNLYKYIADLDPTNPASRLELTGISTLPQGIQIGWKGGVWARQYLEIRQTLGGTTEQWSAVFTNLPPTATATNIIDAGATNKALFYRIKAER